MSGAKHTPGPWRVDPDFPSDVQTADGLREICNPSPSDATDEELLANARLIAAAPDMLAVLKRLDRKGGLGLDVHEWIGAVIAQAEGRP